MLRGHRSVIEVAIRECVAASTYNINVVQLSPATGYIEGEIAFMDGVRLVFFEFWRRSSETMERDKYRYHCMDADNQLIFRYDNAPHHQDIATFPHHKHLRTGIEESRPPYFADVLTEIEAYVLGLP